MNKILFLLATCLSIALSKAALADTVFVGGNPAFQETQAVIHGRSVTVVQMTAYFHQMDLPRHDVQPIGLVEYFFVEKGKHAYQADMCEKWITKILGDEAAWSKDQATYPYFEIDIAPKPRLIKVNSENVYRASDVRCWESMDFGVPVY